ncbi:MAG: hypothetical protein WDM96_03385 [Lacunisphaera sp.]
MQAMLKAKPRSGVRLVVAILALGVAGWQLYYFRKQLTKMDDTLRDAKGASQIAERAAKATEESVKAMQASDERQLRAYVSVGFLGASLVLDRNIGVAFDFECTNHGRTPAKEVGYRAAVSYRALPTEDMPQLPNIEGQWNEKRLNLFPAGPNGQIGKMHCESKTILSEAELSGYPFRRGCLLIGIEVCYLDVFDNRRITREYFRLTSGGECHNIPGGSYVS